MAFGQTLGVSTTQLGVLFILESMSGAWPKQVSEVLGVNKSAITALIGRMEEAGLVRCEPSDADGRAICLFATPQGLAMARAARPILACLNKRLTRDFTEQEIATIRRFLHSILDRF